MLIKVVFDKGTLNKALRTGWGVSFLIDDKILFDTGENGEWLLENMRSLAVDIQKLEAVVISHDHWDHTEGLWEILKEKTGLKVYSCPGFSREFKDKVKAAQAELIETEKFTEISKDIFITGEIPGAYHGKYMGEQAMAVRTKNGLTVITGCAHPGIVKMVDKVKNKFPDERLHLVFGGFHLKESDGRAIEIVVDNFKKMGIMKAGPTHCSGDAAEGIFKKFYGGNFVTVKVGQEMEV